MSISNGIVTVPSKHSVSESLQWLDALVKSRGLTVFGIPATQLLIFGNPTSGTPLMMASPSIALDLPLKALASEDAQGKVWRRTMHRNISSSDTGFAMNCSITFQEWGNSSRMRLDE